VAAINELRDSLDEDSVSKLDGDNLAVAFTVNAPHAAGTLHFTYRSGSEGQTAERPSLECKDTDDSILNLKAINAKLSDRGGIARALALLGRQLGIDLDWAEDAVGGARSDTEDDEDDVMAGSDGDDDGMSYEGGDNHDDEVLREWSRRLVQ